MSDVMSKKKSPKNYSSGIKSILSFWILGPNKKFQSQQNRIRFEACKRCASAVGPVGVATCALLMTMKAYLGVVGGSKALIADAVHSGADLLSALTLIVGLRIANQPADERYPYGYGKVEYVVSVLIYSLLIAAGTVILKDAIYSIINRTYTSPGLTTFAGALVAILINELLFRHSLCAGVQIKSPSMIANAWEKRSDALTSIAVLIGIGGSKLGFYFLDPLAAIFVGCFIFKFSIEMLIEAFNGLMDKALPRQTVNFVRRLTEATPGVCRALRIRTREIGQNVWMDLDISISSKLSLAEATRIKNIVKKNILKNLTRPAEVNVYIKPSPASGKVGF